MECDLTNFFYKSYCSDRGNRLQTELINTDECNVFCEVQVEKVNGCLHEMQSCTLCGEVTVGDLGCNHTLNTADSDHVPNTDHGEMESEVFLFKQ